MKQADFRTVRARDILVLPFTGLPQRHPRPQSAAREGMGRRGQARGWGIGLALLLAVQAMPLSGRQLIEDFSDDADPSQPGLAAAGFSHQFGPNPPGGITFWFLTSGAAGDHSLFLAPATDAVQFQLLPGEVVDQASVEIVDFNGATEVTFVGATDSLTIPVNNVIATLVASALETGAGGQPLGPLQSLDIVSFEGAVDNIVIDTRFTVVADLAVSQTLVGSIPGPAEPALLRWTVANQGPDSAPNTLVTSTIDPNLAFVPQDSDSRCSLLPGQSVVQCPLGELASGQTETLDIGIYTGGGSAGATVASIITGVSDWPDPDPANNTASLSFDVSLAPVVDLAVNRLRPVPSVLADGGTGVLRAEVVNRGPDPSSNSQLTLTLPPGLGFRADLSSPGCQLSQADVSCPLGQLPVDVPRIVEIGVEAQGPPPCATLTATASDTQFDPVPSNNSAGAGFSDPFSSYFDYQLVASREQMLSLIANEDPGVLQVSTREVAVDSAGRVLINVSATDQDNDRESYLLRGDGQSLEILLSSAGVPSPLSQSWFFKGLRLDSADGIYLTAVRARQSSRGVDGLIFRLLDGNATSLIDTRNPSVPASRIATFDVSDDGSVLYLWAESGRTLNFSVLPGNGLPEFSLAPQIEWPFVVSFLQSIEVEYSPSGEVMYETRRPTLGNDDYPLTGVVGRMRPNATSFDLIEIPDHNISSLVMANDGYAAFSFSPETSGPGEVMRLDSTQPGQARRELLSLPAESGINFMELSLARDRALAYSVYRSLAEDQVWLANVTDQHELVFDTGQCWFGTTLDNLRVDRDSLNDELTLAFRAGTSWVVRATAIDTDGDGTTDLEERRGSESDRNADGTDDYLQANVVSFYSSHQGQGRDVVLSVPAPATLAGARAVNQPGAASSPPGLFFPLGHMAFEVRGLTPGSSIPLDIVMDRPIFLAGYYKYGGETGNPLPHWYAFTHDGDTGFERLSFSHYRLHLRDGGRGDDDLAANGVVVDPGGFAVPLLLFVDGFENPGGSEPAAP